MTKFATRFGAAVALCLVATAANAASLDLSRYSVASANTLIGLSRNEASGVTYNWDRKSLMVVGDEGTAMEFGLDGKAYPGVFDYLGISTYNDTEFVTYLGNNKYIIGNERTMQMATVGISSATVDMGSGRTRYYFEEEDSFSLSGGANVGNVGLEGVSYDPITGGYFAVKENNPQGVYFVSNATSANGAFSTAFDASKLGLVTLSDIQVLSTVPGFAGEDFAGNLLILSQSSQKLLEVTRAGDIVSSFDLSGILSDTGHTVQTIEGVTIDFDGNIYLVAELGGGSAGRDSTLIKLSAPATAAVPEPASWAMMIGGLALTGAAMRRRRATVRFAA